MDRAEDRYREGGGVRGDEEYGPHVEAEKRGGGGIRAKRAIRAVQQEDPEQKMQKALVALEKQRLDDAAVQLEKILGIGRRGMKESEKYDRAGQARWGARRRRLDQERADVTRRKEAVTGAAKEGAKRAGGAAAGAAYEATGAAERGAKKAGSALARAFGAGKRKVREAAGAPGRRQERKATERHRSNLRQQATARRVAASEERRDARKQRPTTVQQGRTGYANGHDTGLGGKTGERAAAIPKFQSPSKTQQTDAGKGVAPQQPKPYQSAAKPKWGESGFTDWKKMEKAVIALQKYLDGCGCDGDSTN